MKPNPHNDNTFEKSVTPKSEASFLHWLNEAVKRAESPYKSLHDNLFPLSAPQATLQHQNGNLPNGLPHDVSREDSIFKHPQNVIELADQEILKNLQAQLPLLA